ncbi:MAG TPA: hypothetical protein VK875_08155 [Euzebyales bacterium]|nr:hypothetical protein [Euzebyales bacterium]
MSARRLLSILVTTAVVGSAAAFGVTRTDRAAPPTPTVAAVPVAVAQSSGEDASEHADHGATTPEATLELQSLLGHHVTLAIRLMRATVTGDPGFTDAANASLVRHIGDIEQALEPVVGADGAATFGARWERHTQTLFQYAAAARDDDAAAREQANDELAVDLDELATMFADLTDDMLPRADAEEALRGIAGALTEQVDAYAAGDYERAYELERQVFAEAWEAGQPLAEAATGNTPGSVEYSPREQLSSALAMLLGEHVELAVDAMRAGVDGDDEFEAAAGALDANTADVSEAMSGLFGDDAARRFNALWADHIDLFVDYTVATAQDDTAERERIHDEFVQVIGQFGDALATITDDRVGEAAVADALTMHEDHLLEQIDVYAEGDYEQAHDIAYTAYRHMRDVALVLADGFAAALSEQMPQGGPETGGGGAARAATGT